MPDHVVSEGDYSTPNIQNNRLLNILSSGNSTSSPLSPPLTNDPSRGLNFGTILRNSHNDPQSSEGGTFQIAMTKLLPTPPQI